MEHTVKTKTKKQSSHAKTEKSMTKEGVADVSSSKMSSRCKKDSCGCDKKGGSCDIKQTKDGRR